MKEFKKTNTVTYNLMSFTGFKSLIMFAYLLEAPRSLQDLIDFFKNNEYIHEALSTDTIRVYFSSLKRIGCEIARTKDGRTSRYQIVSHPFRMKIPEAQVKSLETLYKMVSKTNKIEEVLCLDKFLRELAEKLGSTELLEKFNSFSIFKNLDLNLVESLVEHSKHGRDILIEYNSPTSGLKEIKVTANSVGLSNGKLYLYGTSYEYSQETYYQVSRIKRILDVNLENNDKVELKTVTVGYEVSAKCEELALSPDDKIIEIKPESMLIETTTSNLFELKRKILGYGAFAEVLYPASFREEIKSTLTEMYEGYQND